MAFPEAVVEEVEAEVDELEVVSTARLDKTYKEPGAVPVGDKRKSEVLRRGLSAAGSSGSSSSSSSSSTR
jgi:hypothetical protein